MTLEQQWDLAVTWYGSRLDPDWSRRTPQEAQKIFDRLGLTGGFWTLAPGS